MAMTFGKTALVAAILALMAGPALAAGPGEGTATSGSTQMTNGGPMDANGNATGAAERDKRGDSYSSHTATHTNANAGIDDRSNAAMKGKVDGSAAGGITK